ncbi:hypothetical protein RSSM_03910 [Rhodopirellula sallentina SM41]|uniref:Uncharacterized protein n=1 Tax=Rhodopirellula sallentina SM41 TaxID=1263870 RepID=M5UF84_9BACT|nr:hypothetical protein RSSM_03910 [Rhodopirellula sallentina SM41]
MRAIPPADRVQERLSQVLLEAEQLKVLLRLASDLDGVETVTTTNSEVDRD